MHTVEKLINDCNNLLDDEKFEEIITILSPEILSQYQHDKLYSLSGTAHANLSNIDRAFSDCEKAVTLNGNNGKAWSIMGAIEAMKENFPQAKNYLTRAITIDADDQTAYMNRGMTFLSSGDTEKAISDFKKALQLDPLDANAKMGLGNAFLVANRFDDAIFIYNELVDNEERCFYAHYQRGTAFLGKELPERALEDINIAFPVHEEIPQYYCNRGLASFKLSKFHEALTDFNKVLDTDPSNTETRFYRSKCFIEFDQFEKIIEDCNVLLDTEEYYAAGLAGSAFAHDRLNRSQEAISLYRKYLELYPDSIDALLNLSRLYENIDDLPLSKLQCDKILDIDPLHVKALRQRAMIYKKLNQLQLALEDAEKAKELDPVNYDSCAGIASIYQAENRPEEALREYTQALSYAGNTELKSATWLNISTLCLNLGYFHEAIEYLDKYIACNPSVSMTLDMRSEASTYLKQYENALKDLTAAIELEPDNIYFLLNRSFVYQKQLEYEAAMADIDKAIALKPDVSIFYLNRGSIYLETDCPDKALSDYLTVIQLAPENPVSWISPARMERDFILERLGIEPLYYFNRFMLLHRNPSRIVLKEMKSKDYNMSFSFDYMKLADKILDAARKLDAPLAAVKLLSQIGYLESDFPRAPFQKYYSVTRNFRRQFNSWQLRREHPAISWTAEAICNYYLGNPAETIHIFDSEEIPFSCMAYVYQLQAAHVCLEQDLRTVYLPPALEAANQTLNDPEASSTEKYYAAIILDLANQCARALRILEGLYEEGYPAALYKWADISSRRYSAGSREFDSFIRKVRLLHGKYLSTFRHLPVAYVSGNESTVLEEILPVVHAMENAGIIAFIIKGQRFRQFFQNPFDTEYFFAEHIHFIQYESDSAFLSRHKTSAEYRLVFGNEVEKKALEQDIVNYTNRKEDAWVKLGKDIHAYAITAYLYAKQHLSGHIDFNIRHYIILVSNLYGNGTLKEEEAHILHQYIYYCLQKIGEYSVDESITLLINEMKNFIDTAQLIGFGYGTIESTVKYFLDKLKGKESPLVQLEEFVRMIESE